MKNQWIVLRIVLLFTLFLNVYFSIAQNVGINTTGATPDNSAMLDIASTDKGLLIPRMDSTARMNIVTPAEGLMVFDNSYNSFYFYDGIVWSAIGGSDNLGDHIATQNVQLNDNWLNNDGGIIEGIQIDNTGNVGVNITPQGPFQVGTGVSSSVSPVIQVGGFNGYNFLLNLSCWQSFTAPDNVYITSFNMPFASGVPHFDYTLYEGEGTGGTILASGSSTSTVFSFNDIQLLKNQKYTVAFTLTSGVPATSIYNNYANPYAGGRAHDSPLSDFVFTVYAKRIKSGLLVNETGVSFENYTFPNADGAANQVLSTNGVGALNWSYPPFTGYTLPATVGTANQVLSTNGAGTLSWVDKSATLIQDTDQNTKVQVEKNPNEDIIRFDLNGQEKWTMEGNRLSNSQPNVLIGQAAGADVTTGVFLVAVGDSSMANNTTGSNNTAIGEYSMYSNTTGIGNIAVGSNALSSNTTGIFNMAIGTSAMENHTTGNRNVAIGNATGSALTSGSYNTLVGFESGRTVSTGIKNVMLGMYAGINAGNVSGSTLIGYSAGTASNSGVTAVGESAGFYSGIGGVYLGYQAGSGETGDNKLYIDNTNTSTPLIWGDFANDSLKVFGTFNINNAFSFPTADGTSGQVLETDGAGQLTWTTPSSGGTQDLDLSANILSLTGDPTTVDLSGYINTDNQDLSLSSNTLSLTNDGTTVDLSAFAGGNDDLGNHTATQNIQLDTFWLSGDGGDEGITINNNGEVGIGRAVGTNGVAKLELYGPASSANGPHIQAITSESDHPVSQYFNFGHDNVAILFDAYYSSTIPSWKSSDGGSNFALYKTVDKLINFYSAGNAQGSDLAWIAGTFLDTLGNFSIGRPLTSSLTNRLEVEGNASKSTAGDWLANSDARLKKNIKSLSSNDMLEKMLSLNGVTYEWDDNKTNTKRPEGIQYGFTAQNIQEVFPSLVTEDNNGFLQTPYGTYNAMTVEAIRALNDKIEKLENENAVLKSQNTQLEKNTTELADLKNAFAELRTALQENKLSIKEGAINSEE